MRCTTVSTVLTLIVATFRSSASVSDIVIVTPDVLQSDTTQSILVSVSEEDPVPVTITLEDSRKYVIHRVGTKIVQKDVPELFQFNVSCKDVPAYTKQDTRFVYVRASAPATRRRRRLKGRVRVVVNCKTSFVFIQTDKPVYLKDDTVRMRIVAVDTALKPQFGEEITVDIKNPDGIILDRLTTASASSPTIRKYELPLGPTPVEGRYTIIAKYGFKQESISKFFFEVKDYVLPQFDVQIIPPNFVTSRQQLIKINFLAKYTYGKGVIGILDVKLGICQENTTQMKQFFLSSFALSKEENGEKRIFVNNDGYNVFPIGQRLCIVAEVTERASGIKQSSFDSSAWFTDVPVKFDCDLSPPFYRPHLPLLVSVRASYPDGRPVKGAKVVATARGFQQQRDVTAENGIVQFTLNIGNPRGDVEVLVKREGDEIGTKCYFQEFRSRCGEQFTIQPIQRGKLKVGEIAQFMLYSTSIGAQDPLKQYTVVLISRGAIQGYKSVKGSLGAILIRILISPNLANKFCLLAYFTDRCGEIVADKTCVDTSNTFENNVELSLKQSIVLPGEDVTLQIKAASESDVALLAVDKGLYAINGENKLTKDQVFHGLSNLDKSCGYGYPRNDTRAVFEAAGLAAMNSHRKVYSSQRSTTGCPARNRKRRSSAERQTSCVCKIGQNVINTINKPNGHLQVDTIVRLERTCDALYKNITFLREECDSVDTVEEVNQFLDCCLSPLEGVDNRARNFISPFPNMDDLELAVKRRTYFPHSWLWDETIYTGRDGSTTVTVKVPDSITKWIFHGLALSQQEGFGVADPQELIVFKPISVECHLPYSFRRLEQVSVACTVYNYNPRSEKVCVRFYDPPGGVCTAAGLGKNTDYVCQYVDAQDTATFLLPIMPVDVGSVKIEIQLRTQSGGENVVKEIRVEPEGVLREYDYSNELDPEGININSNCSASLQREKRRDRDEIGDCYAIVKKSGKCGRRLKGKYTKEDCCDNMIAMFAVAWGKKCELCPRTEENRDLISGERVQRNRYYIRIPEDHMQGSVSAWISVTGRYMEANIKPVQQIEDLLKLPKGTGEKSLIRFGPNVAIVKYLKAIGRLNEGRSSFLDLLKRGYMYQQKYRHSSGGFSVFEHEQPSTWLSAFALRTFCAARDLIFVDDQVVNGILHFLVHSRQRPTGEFFENTTVRNRNMMGGLQGGDVSLTAYVVISMLECSAPNSQLLFQVVHNGLCKAITYLEKKTKAGAVIQSYSKALVYFAMAKSCALRQGCPTDCQSVVPDLKRGLDLSATKEQCSKHWQESSGQGNAYWYHKPSAVSVEMSAYALCAYIYDNDIEGAKPIARWLNQQRNSRGAFVSTQDTVVALSCLGEFAKHIDVKHNATVKITALHEKSYYQEFTIAEDDYDLIWRTTVPINDVLTVETTGDGLGMIQVHVQYNTPATSFEECAFDFNITAERITKTAVEEKLALIKVCIRHLGINCTSMAIIDIEHLSGYQPCEKGLGHLSDDFCLKNVLDSGAIPGFRRYDITGRSVIFYFDKICAQEALCFNYKMIQKFKVKHQLPVGAEAYDLYRRDIQCTKFFSITKRVTTLNAMCNESATRGWYDPECVCMPASCPKVKAISNRLCDACDHHYGYRIHVDDIHWNDDFRIKVDTTVVEVLKPGNKTVKSDWPITFWISSICKQFVALKEGKDYHLIGYDGSKFLLDHTSLLEVWPPTYSHCMDREKSDCMNKCYHTITKTRNKCYRDSSWITKCKERAKKRCADAKKFEKYAAMLEKREECENCMLRL